MPRYYFHIRTAKGTLVEDEDGVHLPDRAAAREEARLTAASLKSDAEHGVDGGRGGLAAPPAHRAQSRLKRLLGRRKRVLRYVEHLDDGGAEMFAHACRLGLEEMFKAPGSGVSLRPERGMAEDQEPGL